MEDAAALQNEENLVAEVVTVQAGHFARLHTQEARANVRRDEEVFDVFLLAEVENFKGHEQAPLRELTGGKNKLSVPLQCFVRQRYVA